jgi:hypothetical protein
MSEDKAREPLSSNLAARLRAVTANSFICREAADEIERLLALVRKAGDLLTYGAPDKELQSDDGSDWIHQCDEWFRAAGYGQPRAAVETSPQHEHEWENIAFRPGKLGPEYIDICPYGLYRLRGSGRTGVETGDGT